MQAMGQFFSWVKSNEKQILVTLDNLAKKAVEVSEAVVVMLSDFKYKMDSTKKFMLLKHRLIHSSTRDFF